MAQGCEGDQCDDDDMWWTSYKIFTKWEGILILAGVVLISLLILLLVIWRVRAFNYKAGGRFSKVVQLMLKGRDLARQKDVDASDVMYRAAFLNICHGALSEGASAGSAAVAADKALAEYNGVVGLGTALAFSLPSEAIQVGQKFLTATFTDDGLGAEIEGHHVSMVLDGSAASEIGLCAGDQLVGLNGEDPRELSAEAVQQQLRVAGNASFLRDDPGMQTKVLVCSRCATGNSIGPSFTSFRCFSCQATVLVWDFAIAPCDNVTLKKHRSRSRQVWPEEGYPQHQGLTWEDCELSSAIKHPLGFGLVCDPPDDCQHHVQVGATCGVAAVNNLITNCDEKAVDAEHMMAISKNLGQAEAAIRDGAQSVEEAGEEHDVSELYASSAGGHFDVQTLQIAFDEAGFNMWYVPPQKLQKPSTLFEQGKGDADLAGYVVHRKDPMNPRRDHWFVLRRHGTKPVQYLLQDSLFEKVFDLTSVEAHHLLLYLPPGAIFAVSHKPCDVAEVRRVGRPSKEWLKHGDIESL